jgi:tRNA pseudouridine55 synthase
MNEVVRAARIEVDGVVLVDKPIGWTSQQVVSRVKRLFNAKKAGHGGTLDPLATGLLVVGLGEATKFLQRHLNGEKTYEATIFFGSRTSTGDREGEVIATSEHVPSVEQLREALSLFQGEILQTPPVFSALKIDGKPAYARARAGETVTLAPRRVRIHAISLLDVSGARATIRVHCGAGTYIRTLAEDIARACGSEGHLAMLRRTQANHFSIDQAQPLPGIDNPASYQPQLLPPECLVQDLPSIDVDEKAIRQLSVGQKIDATDFIDTKEEIVYTIWFKRVFFGLAVREGNSLAVERWMKSSDRLS